MTQAVDLLTVDEIAVALRVHRRTVLRWVRERRIPAVRIGRCPRIPREHLTARLALVSTPAAA